MSKTLPAELPPSLAQAIAADPADAEGFTLLVIGVVDGWPHEAMIGVGEIVAVEDGVLLALWPSSTITRALTESGRCTVAAVVDGAAYSLRLTVERLDDISTPLAGTLACFHGRVSGARADEAPYAILESGIRFRLRDREPVLARWREQRAALEARGNAAFRRRSGPG